MEAFVFVAKKSPNKKNRQLKAVGFNDIINFKLHFQNSEFNSSVDLTTSITQI
jgi:hypothetical protein